MKPRKVLWPKGRAPPKPGEKLPRSIAEKRAIAQEARKKVGQTWVKGSMKSRKARTGRTN
ncbi:MAG: hypothetical protein JXA43_03490 [Candidatus Diapherotrites archaeon]|nr:hypothetical protein [Candidatus Diapherotrites archaeon]